MNEWQTAVSCVAKYLNDLQKVHLKKAQEVLRHSRQATTEVYVEGNYSGTIEPMKLLELNNVRKRVKKIPQNEKRTYGKIAVSP
jgi:UDP-2,3-diacylglucosamine pyrophosphatase LpxH